MADKIDKSLTQGPRGSVTIPGEEELTEKIQEACDNGKLACGVFIDLKKAFDTVNHTILLKKLEHYGVRGLCNNWFSTYLKERSQYVSVKGNKSQNQTITHGVPQ